MRLKNVSYFQNLLFLTIMISNFFSCKYGDQKLKSEYFRNQIGPYILDTIKTSLSNYKDNFAVYKNLSITFKSDSTFHLNMSVPFIYDSTGKWEASAGGPEDWNWLYYKSNPNISTQFTEPWTEDSIFYLNSVTPQVGQTSISQIYFKKVK